MLQAGVTAIVEAVGESSSRHISSMCSKFHIPHFVTKCRFPDFSDAYPMDISLAPDCNSYAKILYNYITEIEVWQEMVLFHSADNCEWGNLGNFQDSNSNACNIWLECIEYKVR